MKLVLMRHAKSDWSDGSVSDHDRTLNPRGRRDTPQMAAWLSQRDCLPDRILCSSAMRTCETTRLLCDAWDYEPPIDYCQSLYLASPENIFQTICSEGGSADCLLVVAHNPGMSQFASVLANESLEMPTAAVAVFEVDVNQWQSFGSDTTLRLTEFMRPKAL